MEAEERIKILDIIPEIKIQNSKIEINNNSKDTIETFKEWIKIIKNP